MKFSEGQNAARELLGGPQRYSCIVGGARAGKTFILARAIFHRALKGAGSRHAILRFHANAARAAIARDTLPKIARLCFPGLKLKEYRQDGFFEFPNGSQVWIGGLDDKDLGYVLDDRSCREAPAVWARVAVSAYHEFRADCIVAESNFGGEMVRAVMDL